MNKRLWSSLTILLALLFILAACGGNTPTAVSEPPSQTTAPTAEDQHTAEEEQMDDMDDHADIEPHSPQEHVVGAHTVPDEALAIENPVPATNESIETGAAIYSANCAACHGPNGEGDGPASAGLEIKPADLHAEHVQELTDGGLFYIVTHGRTGTAMPAWENVLSEQQRWEVVNYLRTFRE